MSKEKVGGRDAVAWVCGEEDVTLCAASYGAPLLPEVKMPMSLSALIIVLGDNSPSVKAEKSTALRLDSNGVAWA